MERLSNIKLLKVNIRRKVMLKWYLHVKTEDMWEQIL